MKGNVNMSENSNSYFDGGLFSLIIHKLGAALVTVITLGIAYPWALCFLLRWEKEHTVINGHRLTFNGTGMQLFGNWIKWAFFTIITFGIYSFWLNINLTKWITKHTVFAD